MYYCTRCGAYLDEKDLEKIVYDKGSRTDAVCPECLAELCNSIEEVSAEEEAEIHREWEADERYDEMKLREDTDGIW